MTMTPHAARRRALPMAVATSAALVTATLCLGLTALPAGAATAVPPLKPSSKVQQVDCSAGFLTVAGRNNVATVAPRVTCYRLQVPQNRARPGAALTPVSLAIAVIEPVGGAVETAPLLVIPGGAGIAVPRLMNQFFGPTVDGVAPVERLAPGRRIILVDHRGAGLSTPTLTCDGVGFTNSLRFPSAAPVADCDASLTAQGVDLDNFTITSYVADLIAVRREFKVPSWHVFGISYGSVVGLELLRRDAAAIRTVSFDGVSATTKSAFAPAYRINPILSTFDSCAADAACAAAYPDLDGDLVRALSALPADPTFPDTRELSRERFGAALRIGIEFGLEGDAPAMVHAAAAGDYSGLEPFAAAYDEIYPVVGSDAEVDGTRPLTFLATLCSHEASPQRIAGIGSERTYRPVAPIVVASVPAEVVEVPRICAGLGVQQGPSSEIKPVYSDKSALLLNGTVDTATPAFWATDTARTLKNSQTVLFPGTGHTAAINQFDCASALVAAHIARPGRRIDATCATSLPGPVWSGA